MKVYFDGSEGTDDHGNDWITLAGIAGTDAMWVEFDEKWKTMLRNRYPIAPYVHMIKLLDDKDPFEPLAGWDFCKKERLIQDATIVLSEMEKSQILIGRCSINETARNRLANEGREVPRDPILECTSNCLSILLADYWFGINDEDKEPLYIFYDRGERFFPPLKNKWEKERTRKSPDQPRRNWWDRFDDFHDLDMAFNPPIQAADMVAWAHTRALSEKERPYSHLKHWIEKIAPSNTLDLTEEVMRSHKP